MISYTKVIYFIQAPVLNFNIMNTRKMVHGEYESPYYQVFHDIEYHGNVTHSYAQIKNPNKYTKIFLEQIILLNCLKNILIIIKKN